MRRTVSFLSPLVLLVALAVFAQCRAATPTATVPPASAEAAQVRPQVLVYMEGGKQVLPANPSAILDALDVLTAAISGEASASLAPAEYMTAFGGLPRLEAVYATRTTLTTLTGPIEADRLAVVRADDGLRILTQTGASSWAVWTIREQSYGLFTTLADAVASETGVQLDRVATTEVPPTAQTTPAAVPFIKMTWPQSLAILAGQATVEGRAGGLFENQLVIELHDANDQVLAVAPVVLQAPEMGAEGAFSAELAWTPPAERTSGTLWAIYRSPKDGTILAEDHLDVTLAPALPDLSGGPFVEISEPGVVLSGHVTVQGQAGGLFENQLTVELRDASGQTLAQVPVVIQAPDMGARGTFSAELAWASPAQQTSGTLCAIYYSPKDGSIAVQACVEVTLAP
jgi:hypothetical protein